MILSILFFKKIVLVILGPLPYHINFGIVLSMSTKNLPGILIVFNNCTEPINFNLRRIDIFNRLSILIYEHDRSLHLFRSLIFFISILWFSGCRPWTCFSRIIAKYFIFFAVSMDGIVFLFFDLHIFIVIYKCDCFCIFLLYMQFCWIILWVLGVLLVDFLEFSL